MLYLMMNSLMIFLEMNRYEINLFRIFFVIFSKKIKKFKTHDKFRHDAHSECDRIEIVSMKGGAIMPVETKEFIWLTNDLVFKYVFSHE